jgi:hypothetical protein
MRFGPKKIRLELLSLFLVWSVCEFAPAAESLPNLLGSLRSLKRVVIPVGPDTASPVFQFRCGSIQIERKTVGFLRIGLLPQVVLEDVEMRIMHSAKPQVWSEQMKLFLGLEPSLAKALIRRLRIQNADGTSSIAAREARFDAAGKRILLKDIRFFAKAAHDAQSASDGVIHLDGDHAGRLFTPITRDGVIDITDKSISPLANTRDEKP